MIVTVTLTYKILQNPLDKIFDHIPGGSPDFEPRDGGGTKELKFCLQIYGDFVSFVLVVFQIAEYENRRIQLPSSPIFDCSISISSKRRDFSNGSPSPKWHD